jgi:hypothetical protein
MLFLHECGVFSLKIDIICSSIFCRDKNRPKIIVDVESYE